MAEDRTRAPTCVVFAFLRALPGLLCAVQPDVWPCIGHAHKLASQQLTGDKPQRHGGNSKGDGDPATQVVDTAKGKAETAKGMVDTAKGKAETVKGMVDTAKGKAETAKQQCRHIGVRLTNCKLHSCA